MRGRYRDVGLIPCTATLWRSDGNTPFREGEWTVPEGRPGKRTMPRPRLTPDLPKPPGTGPAAVVDSFLLATGLKEVFNSPLARRQNLRPLTNIRLRAP